MLAMARFDFHHSPAIFLALLSPQTCLNSVSYTSQSLPPEEMQSIWSYLHLTPVLAFRSAGIELGPDEVAAR